MPSSKHMTETSTRFFSTLNVGDIEGWLGTLASDARSYEPVGSPPNEGHEGLLKWLQALSAPFESMKIEVGDVYAAGNSAAITWTAHAKLKNKKDFQMTGVDVHEYNEQGKIQTVKGYFDPAPMMALFN